MTDGELQRIARGYHLVRVGIGVGVRGYGLEVGGWDEGLSLRLGL